ncbi:type-F conjugative transfer system protein TrbI [Thiotrichales bacterium 19S11-10]|nr:type-F conjugative transfer system protein TrbI [Thiotrichales bacterium 19S11-10]
MSKLSSKTILFVTGILLVLWVGFLLGKSNHQTIGFINMKEVINKPIKMIASKMKAPEQEAFIKLYNANLAITIKAYGEAHHINLITATTLYDASGIDLTDEIIQENLNTMEHAL